jgi:hypothetical protein
VGGDLCTSWHKGEHGSRKVMVTVVQPLLKPTEEDGGGVPGVRSMGEGGLGGSGASRSGGVGAR